MDSGAVGAIAENSSDMIGMNGITARLNISWIAIVGEQSLLEWASALHQGQSRCMTRVWRGVIQ